MLKLGLGLQIRNNKVPQGFTYDPIVTAVLAAANSSGDTPPNEAAIDAMNTLFVSLRATGYLDRTDVLWIPGSAGDKLFAGFNYINPALYKAIAPAGTTYTSKQGFNAGANNANIVPAVWNPATNAVNFLLNDCHVMVYYHTAPTVTGAALVSTGNSKSLRLIGLNAAGTASQYYINTTSPGTYTPLSAGMVVMDRSTSTDVELLFNGVQVDTEARASVAIPSGSVSICGEGSVRATNATIFAVSYGGSLADIAADVYAAFSTYHTAIQST